MFLFQVIEALPGDAVSQMVPDIVPGLLKVCLSHMHACALAHLTTYRDPSTKGNPDIKTTSQMRASFSRVLMLILTIFDASTNKYIEN